MAGTCILGTGGDGSAPIASSTQNAPTDLRCTISTEDGFDGAIKEDVAERNGTQEDSEEGTKQVHVSIVRLRQQEEFVCDLQRLIHGCEPECPDLERPQAVHHHETEH